MPCPFCGTALVRSKIRFVYTLSGKRRFRMLRCSKCRKNFIIEKDENYKYNNEDL